MWGPGLDDALSKGNRNTISHKGYFQFSRNKNPLETKFLFLFFFLNTSARSFLYIIMLTCKLKGREFKTMVETLACFCNVKV